MRKTKTSTATSALLALLLAACGGDAADRGPKTATTKSSPGQELDAAAKAAAPSLEAGQPVQGRLAAGDPQLLDGTHYRVWTYQGTAGENVSITLESEEFDPYLLLGLGVGSAADWEILAEDDDGAGDLNARIEYTLPETGEYMVVANTYWPGETGAYTLTLDSGTGGSYQPLEERDWGAMYPGGGDPRGKYALLVGIDSYGGTANDLDGPVADARLIGQILVENYGFAEENVVILTDEEATRDHITQAFLRHLGQAGPNGVSVFYYSGHGMQMDGNYALSGALDPESDSIDEALFVRGPTEDDSIILDDELGFLADRLATERVLFIIDACFAGTGTRGGSGGQAKEVSIDAVKASLAMPATFLTGSASGAAGEPTSRSGVTDLLAEPQRHLLLAASTDDQLSWTASGWPQYGGTISVFTYYLAQALETAGRNATFEQVIEQVRTQTNQYAQQAYNAPQTPQVEGTQRGTPIREFLGAR